MENDCDINQIAESSSTRALPQSQKQILQGAKQLQKKILMEAMQIDPICGNVLLQVWQDMLTTSNDRDKQNAFENFDEYIRWRKVDAAC
ncbi:hypothetical protein AA313_de0205776 [Arthrobotrys entomopaga]|nr:hypothetical protein AA313_de0205776 [Arthrobotrys entomopaga]